MTRLLVLVVLALIGAAAAPVRAQDDPCVTTPVGSDGVFLLKVSDICPSSAYVRAEDVPAGVEATGQAPDGYVLVADLLRDTDGAELMVLVKPWSLNTYTLGLTLSRLFQDGLVEGDGWHQVVPVGHNSWRRCQW